MFSTLHRVHALLIKGPQIPLTNPYPGPRSVLILDNCSIHHAEEIRHLVEDEACTCARFLGFRTTADFHLVCKLVFLPPYSPDYNPIELAFAHMKAFFRRNRHDRTLSVMDRACYGITPRMAKQYFIASGYM